MTAGVCVPLIAPAISSARRMRDTPGVACALLRGRYVRSASTLRVLTSGG